MKSQRAFGAGLVVLMTGCAIYSAASGSAGRCAPEVSFRVSLRDTDLSPLDRERLLGARGDFRPGETAFLPPGQPFEITLAGPAASLALEPRAAWLDAGGSFTRERARSIRGVAPPRAGMHALLATEADAEGGRTTHRLALLVLLEAERAAPAKKDRLCALAVAGEKLGDYPDPAKAKNSRRVREHPARYAPPRFFARIAPENENLALTDEISLGQMIGFIGNRREGKGTERHTHVFPVSRPLIQKLDRLAHALREQGLAFKHLAITSGFRTPRYNASIGGASHSRHIYGDAADIYIDDGGDERMDDLTGDGKADRADALLIANALRALELAGEVVPGGIGVYEFRGADSCFAYIHIDCRAFVTRWGSAPGRRGKRVGLDWWPPEEYREDEE